jgi:hypothetical protein
MEQIPNHEPLGLGKRILALGKSMLEGYNMAMTTMFGGLAGVEHVPPSGAHERRAGENLDDDAAVSAMISHWQQQGHR